MSRGSIFRKYYSEYMGLRSNFDIFHNQVINMPRDHFDGTNIDKVRTLAGYLLLVEGEVDDRGLNYKQLMGVIKKRLDEG